MDWVGTGHTQHMQAIHDVHVGETEGRGCWQTEPTVHVIAHCTHIVWVNPRDKPRLGVGVVMGGGPQEEIA